MLLLLDLLTLVPRAMHLFQRPKEASKPDNRKELFLRKLLQDGVSQLSLDKLKSNHELLDALTDAAVGGGVDDKEYVVSMLSKSFSFRLI